MEKEIILYSSEKCHNCMMVKNKLKMSNIDFKEEKLTSENIDIIISLSGIYSAPIVKIDNEYFTGLESLTKLGVL